MSGIRFVLTLFVVCGLAFSVRAFSASVYNGRYVRFNLQEMLQPIAKGAVVFNESIHAMHMQDSIPATVRQQFVAPGARAICPAELRLSLRNGTLPIPSGLSSIKDDCGTSAESSVAQLANNSKVLSNMLRMLLGDAFDNIDTELFTVQLPSNALQCKADAGAPFDTIALLPLWDVLVVYLNTILTTQGMRPGVFSYLFSPNETATTVLWDTPYAAWARKQVRDAMESVENKSILALFRQSTADSGRGNFGFSPPDAGVLPNSGVLPNTGALPIVPDTLLQTRLRRIFSSHNPPCMYVSGQDISRTFDTLAVAIVPLFAHLFVGSRPFPTLKLFPTETSCNKSIIEGLDSLTLGSSTRSSIQGINCSSLNLHSFHEAESSFRNGTELERISVSSANFILQLQKDIGTPADTIIMNAKFVNESSNYVEAIQSTVLKTTMHVGHLNFSGCLNSSSKAKEAMVILVPLPAAFFYCHSYANTTKSLPYPCASETTQKNFGFGGNRLYSHAIPPQNATVEPPSFNVGSSRILSRGYSAIITTMKNSTAESCLLSYNETEARDIRAAMNEMQVVQESGKNISSLHEASPSPSQSAEASRIFPLPSGVVPLVTKSNSPTPSATSSPSISVTPSESVVPHASDNRSGNSNGSVCFPADVEVLMRGGNRIRMDQLRIGDEIAIGDGAYSTVMLFTHARRDIVTEMYEISGRGWKVVLSGSHILPCDNRLIPANRIRPGDAIRDGQGIRRQVENVKITRKRGLFNPQTTSGLFLVAFRGLHPVQVTAYTTFVPPFIAHSLLSPLRMLHKSFGTTISSISSLFPDTNVLTSKSIATINGLKKLNSAVKLGLRKSNSFL